MSTTLAESRTVYRAAVAGLLAVLATAVFTNSWGVAVTDVKPEVYLAPSAMISQYLSSWQSTPYLGNPNLNTGLLPVVVALAPLELVGFSPEMIYKVLHLALWVIAAAGMGRLVSRLGVRDKRWVGLSAGVLYVVNPYAVVGGSTLAILLPYALLPWLLVALVKALTVPRSWRGPAAFGLVFFAMSGMNAGVVPLLQLLAIPPFAAVVGHALKRSMAQVVMVLAKCGLVAIGVSLYWLVPSWAAAQTGLHVVAESETVSGIAQVSSLVEVLRGMGMWVLYGNGPEGPWIPEFAAYTRSPGMVLATLAWPALALVALRWAEPLVRRVASVLIGLAAVVMTGFFPGYPSTPLGVLIERLFEAVPTLLAFRTTNKFGSVLALALALSLGSALPRWVRALRGFRIRRAAAGVAALAFVGTWIYPIIGGNWYVSRIDVPRYWVDAARAIDELEHSSRVLLLPNQVRPSYRWTPERPDDLPNSLFRREAVVIYSLQNASPPGANYLAALGDVSASEPYHDASVSAMARYLGVGDVLLRHDMRWEDSAGVRPDRIARVLGADPGLVARANFGQPSENVVGSFGAEGLESVLPPLQLYGVRSPLPTVSARPNTGQIIVAGDGWSFEQLARVGHLESNPVVRYALDLSPEEFSSALASGARVVLTDTNRRQELIPNRLTAGYGPLLPESIHPRVTRALGESDDQTVRESEGPTIEASQSGSVFFDLPYGEAVNAWDGDEATSWLFGDFRTAEGATLDITWPHAVELGRITVRTTSLGPTEIDRLTFSAGDEKRSTTVSTSGHAAVDFGPHQSDHLRLTIEGLRGEGYSLVGITELGLPTEGPTILARLPQTIDRLVAGLSEHDRKTVAEAPMDVLLSRVVNSADPADDSEKSLDRRLRLPADRRFTANAVLRVQNPSVVLDHLSGLSPDVAVRSSPVLLDNPDLRAWMALDGKPGTGWVPADGQAGSWWEVTGPERRIPEVIATQPAGQEGAEFRTATKVAVEIDGNRLVTSSIGPGRYRVALPAGTIGRTVRVVVLEVSGDEDLWPPSFSSIDVGLPHHLTNSAGCTPVAHIDGQPLLMRPSSARWADSERSTWVACGTVTLRVGEHEIRSVTGDVVVDELALIDELNPPGTGEELPQLVRAIRGGPTDQEIFLARSSEPVVLKIGQSYDPRWRATVDGEDAGPPIVVDGWSTGWQIQQSGSHRVQVRFGPQRSTTIGQFASGAILLLAAGAVVVGHRRTRGSDPHGMAEPILDSRPAWLSVPVIGSATVIGFGWPGLVGLAAHLVRRRLRLSRGSVGIVAGVVLLMGAGVLQVLLSHPTGGSIGADGLHDVVWPHRLAVVGLVLVLAEALGFGAGRVRHQLGRRHPVPEHHVIERKPDE